MWEALVVLIIILLIFNFFVIYYKQVVPIEPVEYEPDLNELQIIPLDNKIYGEYYDTTKLNDDIDHYLKSTKKNTIVTEYEEHREGMSGSLNNLIDKKLGTKVAQAPYKPGFSKAYDGIVAWNNQSHKPSKTTLDTTRNVERDGYTNV